MCAVNVSRAVGTPTNNPQLVCARLDLESGRDITHLQVGFELESENAKIQRLVGNPAGDVRDSDLLRMVGDQRS